MLDLTQTLLIVVIVILTTIMTIIGIQIIFILRDVRQLFTRLGGLIDRIEMSVSNFGSQFSGLGAIVEGIKSGVGVVEQISNLLGRKPKTTGVEDYMDQMHGEQF